MRDTLSSGEAAGVATCASMSGGPNVAEGSRGIAHRKRVREHRCGRSLLFAIQFSLLLTIIGVAIGGC